MHPSLDEMLKVCGLPGMDLENGVFRTWWLQPAVVSFLFATFTGHGWSSFAGCWICACALKSCTSPVDLPDGTLQDVAVLQCLAAEVVTGVFTHNAAFSSFTGCCIASHAYEEHMLGIMILPTMSSLLEMSCVIPFWTVLCK
jgi:hypothetical protein